MRKDTLTKVTADLKDKYPDIGIQSITVDDKSGKASFFLEPTKKALAFLPQEKASIVRRDPIDRSVLDLIKPDPFSQNPKTSFERAIKYYYTDPDVGSVTNFLANVAAKGFENDIDDQNIKNFYDVWAFDVNFVELLDWVFLDFFRTGQVYTYKTIAKYEPRVSYLSPIPGKKMGNGKPPKKPTKTTGQEDAAKKNIWSKGHLPIAYTVLNPTLVTIEGSLLFDKYTVTLKPSPELTTMLKKPAGELSMAEKELIKSLPSDLKAAAEKGGDVVLDPRLVNTITYRKLPYEKYARPRSLRVFETIDYKQALRQADLSTLDGITNYILKITIGNDEYPVTTQAELEAVAELFNTPSKSFDVVWNHTLEVEKIVSPEIEAILGQEKYGQVNDDMQVGLAVSRAFIDGGGKLNQAEAGLVVKGVIEEINYARRQVSNWIYEEYRQLAEVMGFDRFPKIRWDEGVLRDTILYMSTISSLVDRRMLSYQTALESLGFDYPNELQSMESELPLVKKGTFGILGSPWQQSKSSNVQTTQRTPTGTPSEGRPDGKPAKKKEEVTQPNKKLKTTTKKPTKQSAASIKDIVKDMEPEEFIEFLSYLNGVRNE